MANIDLLAPMILKFEGGYVNNPADHGGPTNMGITLSTWKQVGYDKDGNHVIDEMDIKLLNRNDFTRVLRLYWDRWRGDEIHNQSLANILVDWVWGSGKWGVTIPQTMLGVVADGNVGFHTIGALNSQNSQDFFNKIYARRVQFLQDIVRTNPSQAVFLHGWLNRLSDFKYSQ